MLNKIIHFSITNKIVIALLTLVLIVWGIRSALQLPVDAVPDITNNQVQIITNAPTLATQEVEQLVTYPIEQQIANLPHIEELRSISRFGLSVITAVFEEDVDIWFARQLINERIKEAETLLPNGVGSPEMAPVSTGLGEVYQYVLHNSANSPKQYDAMELRTMQDWIVARQLYGTAGVAEVNSFGGLVKQYEVAVDPNKLLAMGVSIPEIFSALEKNNENTGGAYIDKKPNAWFIRGVGMITSLADIESIVVKTTQSGIPISIKDIARVQFGSAVRYGALTYNGDIETVGGVVMMLKGANSGDVVNRVKEKMSTIQKSLPEGVVIEPYLDRTELVGRAISTVEKNLIEGALIVIFVLILFLGNLRAGLIVASAIPLSLLFALGMMHTFNISANLMSLGAIDFGLIIDGALIIVEATLHHLGIRKTSHKLTQAEMDLEVYESTSKIRTSAAFGEIIILIVYIPILTLVGIEGKMFKPMAQTVSFAILGALLLSLTYIPMMCAQFLPKTFHNKRTFSDKFMEKLQSWYTPLLRKALRIKYILIGGTVVFFAICVGLFSRMGGEFIPNLKEGDFAFHCILTPGSSLSQSIETSMHASRIIKSFPEVKMVVSKTGSAEVPTDPMPPEISDMMVILHPQKEWESGRTYDELGDAIEAELAILPGIFFEKNQPIQMRFNELMTGIRQDVAVKIFGENLDSLLYYSKKVATVIQDVPGTTEPSPEKVEGLPQITIEYNRQQLAGYGLQIEDVNHIISTAFAGGIAGKVFENERRFDLVVRLDSVSRSNMQDVSNLYIPVSNGSQIPLSQIARISMKPGPAQISREDGKRRIVIGFNVKDRDVESTVNELHARLEEQIQLPSGYYFTYGGAFENLQKASARLMIAVPVALLLIFMLLYFTFHSFKQAGIIFTAIPMAATGGVLALLLRDMPFSISAGVGFIALFGVAVLNGIVLIAKFNQLEKEGWKEVIPRVLEGTRIRLRPVLMTATVASLGFLPMALSQSAGAEVQKPLATVVIGGLVSATLLTLFIIPLLYVLFTKAKNNSMRSITPLAVLFVLIAGSLPAQAQKTPVHWTLETTLDSAMRHNLDLKIQQQRTTVAALKIKTGANLPQTGIFVENDEMRPSDKKGILKIGLSQEIAWPGLYGAQKNLLQEEQLLEAVKEELAAITVATQVRKSFYTILYLEQNKELFLQMDSLIQQLASAASISAAAGASSGLDKISAASRSQEWKVKIEQLNNSIRSEQELLAQICQLPYWIFPAASTLQKLPLPASGAKPVHPLEVRYQKEIAAASAHVNVMKQQNKPSFSGRFFSQRLYGTPDPYTGFGVGTSIPLFGLQASRAKIKVAKEEMIVHELEKQAAMTTLETEKEQLLQEIARHTAMLDFYESTGIHQANEIIKAAQEAYQAGEISFIDVTQFMLQAIDIKRNHVQSLHQYNQAVIQLLAIMNQ